MADSHLFFSMENTLKVCRMHRRKKVETLESMLDMYAATWEQEDLAIGVLLVEELDKIIEMNTDAYGIEYFPCYQGLMAEAARRGMREPLNPLYEKEPI